MGDPKWLFIVGINNGGTSIIAYLLEQYEKVDRAGLEGHDAKSMPSPNDTPTKLARTWSENINFFRYPRADPEKVKKEWLEMRRTTRGEYILEKSPPNCLRMPWLQTHFNPAYFVIITRDPVPVCEGIRRKKPSVDLKRAAHHYTETWRTVLEDLDSIERKVVISYEELCDNTLEVMSPIEDWLTLHPIDYTDILDVEIDMKIPHIKKSKLKNFNAWSYNKLTADEVALIKRYTNTVTKRLGY